VFYQQKVLFKESSFRVLRQCFLTMPAVNKYSQRIQSLEFANAYRHWDEDEWKQVMFSDESQEHGGVDERDHWAVDPEDEG
jgi:hypothetical protein